MAARYPADRRRSQIVVLALLFGSLYAVSGSAAGLLIDAPDRVDAIYDGQRGLVYISTSTGDLLRYDVAGRRFLPPLALATSGLMGLAVSPDGSKLAVADREFTGAAFDISVVASNWIHVVDLDTWTSRRIEFARQHGEIGTYMVEFVDDDTVITTSSFSGSGWVPMRRVELGDGTSMMIASVRQSTMLSASSDQSVLFYAEGNISSGEFGVYDPIGGTFRESGTGWFNFEAAANRDATQFAVPSFNGMFVFDADFGLIERIGVSTRMSPIGVAYHPTEDIVYTTWWGTNEAVQAYDSKTLMPLGVIDDGFTLGWIGNGAFRQGRTRIARDGSGLTVTVPDGVKLFAPITFIDDDPDDDGVLNRDDNCPETFNPDQADTDGDRVGDACNDAEDADGDDWADRLDNCPGVANDQTDRDQDGLGDPCDPFPDRDDNGLAQCEFDRDAAQARVVELETELGVCRMPSDDDDDGVPDDADACPGSASSVVDPSGCSQHQFCEERSGAGLRGLLGCIRADWTGNTRWRDCRPRFHWGLVRCSAR